MTSLTFEGFFSGSAKPIAASFNLPFEHSALTGFCSKLLTILRIGPIPVTSVHDAFRKFIFAQPRPTAIFAPVSHLRRFIRLCRRRRRQRSGVSAQISMSSLLSCSTIGCMTSFFRGAAAEENQLPLHKEVRLPRRRRDVLGLGYASLTMTRRAQRRFFLDRIVSREASCFCFCRPLEDRRQPQLSGRIA